MFQNKTDKHPKLIRLPEVKRRTGAELRYIYLDKNGEFDYDDLESKLDSNTKVVSFSHGVNATGILHDVKKVVDLVRQNSNAKIILDACQSVAHEKIDVIALDVDYLVFSAHKIFGPVGIGVVYIKEELLELTHPLLFGGDMIEFVEEQEATFREGTQKFEGGTQSVEAAVGLSAAIDFVEEKSSSGKIKWIQNINGLYSEVIDLQKLTQLFSSTYNGRKYL